MDQVELDGLRVTLEDPVQVSEGVGHCHFPGIGRFATGELLASMMLVADAHGNHLTAQRICISTDAGRTWEPRYTVSEAMTGAKFPLPNGDMLMTSSPVSPDPPGQWRSFAGPYVRYQDGGKRIVVEDRGMRVEGLPRDVAALPDEWVLPGQVNKGNQAFGGPILEVDGRMLTPMYLRFAEHERVSPFYSTVVFESEDEGRNWRYLSTVSGPNAVPGAPHGPCEPALVMLETGELMCVMRVGWEGRGWPMVRSYSADGGRTWSPTDRMPGWSVAPDLLRLANGTLLLCAGRPGSYLWLSTDPRGETWQRIDLLAHHNKWAPGPEHTIVSQDFLNRESLHKREQTTSYMSMVEVEPDRVLLAYDRIPFGWNPVPSDSDERSRVYVVPFTVDRT